MALCIAFLVATCIRIVVSGLWFIPKYHAIGLMLRRIAFQMMFVLSGVFLLPVLSMILRSTDTRRLSCPYNHYLDFRANTPDFLDYFVERNVSCTRCTEWSKYGTEDERCRTVCTFNVTQPLEYKVLKDAIQVSDDDLSRVYLIPINLLEVYFLVVFMQIQRNIFTRVLDLVEFLPAPTRFIEAKFGSILDRLQTKAGYIFASYRHEQALFYFTFTQIKLFVLFFASLFPIFPIDEVKDQAVTIIPWMFFIASLIIATTQFFGQPYISVLHNYVNGVGYLVGGIAALIAALVVMGVSITPALGDTFYVLLFVGPIVTAVVIPFFARKNADLVPTTYHLEDVVERDKALTQSYKRRMNKVFNLVGDADEEEDIEPKRQKPEKDPIMAVIQKLREKFRKKAEGEEEKEKKKKKEDGEEEEELSYDPEFKVIEFALASLSPIHVQKAISKRVRAMRHARDIWASVEELKEADMVIVVKEMLDHADHLLDVASFNSLVKLLSMSMLFVSLCAGWGLGSGTALWVHGSDPTVKSLDFYLRCNAENGVFPEFGTY
jgi:hypothetical protein